MERSKVDADDLAALFGLGGRVALVTGAARGLGYEIAQGLGRAGATVLLNGRSAARLAGPVARLRGAGLEAHPATFDAADAGASRAALAAIRDTHGAVDILVANVGERMRRRLHDIDRTDFCALLDVNVAASYELARELAPAMAEREWGRLVFLSSTAARLASPATAAYSASKAALESVTRSFAVAYGHFGVTANAIAPGAFATEANEAAAVSSTLAHRVPVGRWGRPAEIAGAAVFLASPSASYVNGHVLTVDGGMTATLG